MIRRMGVRLLHLAVVLVGTTFGYLTAGGLYYLTASVFRLGERGVPDQAGLGVVLVGTLAGFGIGLAWSRSISCYHSGN